MKRLESKELLGLLHDQITGAFSRNEIEELAFKLLGTEFDSLPGYSINKSWYLRSFLAHMERTGQMDKLLALCRHLRPNLTWPPLLFPEPSGLVDPLPPPPPGMLIGRTAEIENILQLFWKNKNYSIINIWGLGGIGKTALARKIAERAKKAGYCKGFVWTTAQESIFIGEKIHELGATNYNFEKVIDEICRQCNLDVAGLNYEQRIGAITQLFNKTPYLLVMDNLEVIQPATDVVLLVEQIRRILGQGRLLLTSRHDIHHEQVHSLRLKGLSEPEAITFLRKVIALQNTGAHRSIDKSKLRQIYELTNGAPLAMQLVVGQLRRPDDFDDILKQLKQASVSGRDYEFYKFVYKRSWDLLDHNSRLLLIDMSVFPPNIGGVKDDIVKHSSLSSGQFGSALSQLISLALVEINYQHRQIYYALHSLTNYFIRSDITGEGEWDEL